jgi:hypothetical protein
VMHNGLFLGRLQRLFMGKGVEGLYLMTILLPIIGR